VGNARCRGTLACPAAPTCRSASSGVGEEGAHSGVLSLLLASACDDRRGDGWWVRERKEPNENIGGKVKDGGGARQGWRQ
jgi:hypothetical protein